MGQTTHSRNDRDTVTVSGTQVLFSYKEYYLPGNLLTHTLLELEKEKLEGSISLYSKISKIAKSFIL